MVSVLPRRSLVLAAGMAGLAATATAQPADEPVKVMERYAAALKAKDVEGLVALYAANGVFMRDEMGAVVGRDARRAAYKQVFATLKVDLSFTVQEVEVVGDIAWLRSTSAGKVKILATGVETDDSYNQLIVFRREGGTWKIRSYLYASNKPVSGRTPT
ncbi:MAG: YybH family protein [Reyranellales bacterium]